MNLTDEDQNQTLLIKPKVIRTGRFINQQNYSIYEQKTFSQFKYDYYKQLKLNKLPKQSSKK